MPARAKVPGALARARLPPSVLGVLRRLDQGGHRSWLVGGVVRDLLLGRPHRADFDVATPATPERVMALFPRSVPTGVDHGTVTVLVPRPVERVEVTTFRGEGDYRDGRRPSSVTFHEDIDLDLARRDFTINALAWDPIGRAFRDPFGGLADLRRRRIRAVGDPAARFGEDGLRPLRAVRLAAQLGFDIDPPTRRAIRGALPTVARVSAERIQDELSKLLAAPGAADGLATMEGTGLLETVLPELSELSPRHRAHALAAARACGGGQAPRLAALLHATAADAGRGQGPGQRSPAAGRRAREALLRLRFPAALAEDVEALVGEQGCLLAPGRPPAPATGPEVRRLLARVGPGRAAALLELAEADARGLSGPRARKELLAARALRRRVAAALAARPPLSVGDLALDGREVMALLELSPGREVGEGLRHLLGVVLEDPRQNTRPRLRAGLAAWWAARER